MLMAMHLCPLVFIQYAISLRKKVVVSLGTENDEVLVVDQFAPSSDTNKDWLYIVHSLFSLLSNPNTTPPYKYEDVELVIDP